MTANKETSGHRNRVRVSAELTRRALLQATLRPTGTGTFFQTERAEEKGTCALFCVPFF